jgi:hypothetical protein
MSVEDLLMPGGVPVGRPGRQKFVRELPGGLKGAESFFDLLTKEGMPNTPPTYPGKGFDLPGGGWIGLRPASKSGEPTIDLDLSLSLPFDKLKFI